MVCSMAFSTTSGAPSSTPCTTCACSVAIASPSRSSSWRCRRAGAAAGSPRLAGIRAGPGVLVAVALAVGVPLTWYLASPIFIRTALVEPAPVDRGAPSSAAIRDRRTGGPDEPRRSTPPTAPDRDARPRRRSCRSRRVSGSFYGSDDFHFGRGTATIVETSPGRFHLRLEDFSVRNGPDLFVYLSPAADGYDDGALEIGKLKATDGSFGYDLPDGTDPADFASAIIWCKQFSHLFATAPFESA